MARDDDEEIIDLGLDVQVTELEVVKRLVDRVRALHKRVTGVNARACARPKDWPHPIRRSRLAIMRHIDKRRLGHMEAAYREIRKVVDEHSDDLGGYVLASAVRMLVERLANARSPFPRESELACAPR